VDAAANTNPPAAAEASTERVVVTGSYIPTAETESALPVTVYTAQVLQKQGAQTPAEGLRQLPSFVGNTATENNSNGGDGQAFVSLRALGPANTLVLINGRRAFGFTNINAIPIGAVSRSEILKDGASAIYGSDAVAGVVNFILLNGPGEAPYEGAEIDLLYGNTTDTDARVLQAYVKGGVATDKVSVAAAAEYYDRDTLFSRDREISSTADQRPLGGPNGGSPTYPGRLTYRQFPAGNGPNAKNKFGTVASVLVDFTNNAPSPANVPGALPGQVISPSYRLFDPDGPGTDPTRFNFRAYTPAIPAQEKYEYYATGRYKIFGEGLQVYGDIMYAKTKQDNGLAPAPFALGNAEINASKFNPFLNPDGNPGTTADNQLTAGSYRLVNELGNRRSFFDYDFYRYVVGFNGDFNFKDNNFVSNFGYDTGFVYERSDQLEVDSGDARRSYITAAIRGELPDGSPLLDPAGNQIFFNPFIGLNAPVAGTAPVYGTITSPPTPGFTGVPIGTAAYDNLAATNVASFIARSFFLTRDYLYDVKLFGNLFPGLYNGGIGAIIGYEHRNNRAQQIPDPTQVQNDQLGFTASPLTKYRTEVNSYFGELRIPLVTSTMNVPFVRSFEVAIAYRFEEFQVFDLYGKDNFFTTDASFDNGGTPRISIRYQPIADLTLRFSYGQSFLSPAGFQLFDPVTQNFPQLTDTFFSGTLQPPDGVFQGGNAALKPEETDSYTAGLVYTPKWLSGFTLTVDFYQIFTRNVILPAADFAQLLLTANANSGGTAFVDGDGPGGGQVAVNGVVGGPGIGVTRDETGALRAIDSLTANAGKRLVNGMDITAVYQLPTQNWGTFTFSLGYNYFFTWKAEPIEGVGSTSFLGDYNNGTLPLAPGALPYHKGFLRGEWQWHGFDFVATGNYISSFNDDSAFLLDASIIGGTDTNPQYDLYRRVSDYITLDMQLSYEFRKPEVAPVMAAGKDFSKDGKSMSKEVAGVEESSIWQRLLWGTTIRVGVNNAFDRNPPSVIGAFNDNYDTSLYTIRNRFWYIGLNKKF
jgi:iron complex outermembrane receptor protein